MANEFLIRIYDRAMEDGEGDTKFFFQEVADMDELKEKIAKAFAFAIADEVHDYGGDNVYLTRQQAWDAATWIRVRARRRKWS